MSTAFAKCETSPADVAEDFSAQPPESRRLHLVNPDYVSDNKTHLHSSMLGLVTYIGIRDTNRNEVVTGRRDFIDYLNGENPTPATVISEDPNSVWTLLTFTAYRHASHGLSETVGPKHLEELKKLGMDTRSFVVRAVSPTLELMYHADEKGRGALFAGPTGTDLEPVPIEEDYFTELGRQVIVLANAARLEMQETPAESDAELEKRRGEAGKRRLRKKSQL